MGCLFPVWYKGNSRLSLSELKAIFDTKKAAFAAKMDTNTSYKMSALNRWTVGQPNIRTASACIYVSSVYLTRRFTAGFTMAQICHARLTSSWLSVFG